MVDIEVNRSEDTGLPKDHTEGSGFGVGRPRAVGSTPFVSGERAMRQARERLRQQKLREEASRSGGSGS